MKIGLMLGASQGPDAITASDPELYERTFEFLASAAARSG